jgi:hypothetical protein
MSILKGFTQLTGVCQDVNEYESHAVWGWHIEEGKPNLTLSSKGSKDRFGSGWKPEDGPPGRNHDAYNKFYIWFEYD